MRRTHRCLTWRRCVQATGIAAVSALCSTIAPAQTTWRDGSIDSGTQQLDDWREANRRQEQRDRVLTDRVRDLQATERQWQPNDRAAPDGSSALRLFPEPSFRQRQGRR